MVMLVLSLIAMLGVSIYLVNGIYRNHRSWQSTSQKTATSQQVLEEFSGTDFTQLAERLALTDAQLYVESNGFILFSNMQDDREDLTAVVISSTTHTTYIDDEIVISRKLASDGQIYHLYVLLEDLEEEREMEEFQTFLIQILLVGGSGTILVVLLNFIFTRQILSVIVRPLDELHSGVERIQEGNYGVALTYQGDREFEELTQGFNQMQTSLMLAHEKNRLYEQQRTKMIADISHDLRTPLTSIKGYAKGILDGVAQTEEKKRDYVAVIYQKSQVMERLLERLFAFSQLKMDKMPFDKVLVDIGDFLRAYIAEKNMELEAEEVLFQLDVSERLLIEIDPIQFYRILDNLVENARKYAAVSPLVLNLSASGEGKEVVWTFTDNGVGVLDSELNHLFEEFYRVDDTRQQVEGHGLGLAIVRDLTERMGGRVEVGLRSGLSFTFRMPRKDME